MSSRYLSLEDVLSEDERVPAQFVVAAARVGHLDPSGSGGGIARGARVDLPLWLAESLAAANLVGVEIPRAWGARAREALAAAPVTDRLRDRSPCACAADGVCLLAAREAADARARAEPRSPPPHHRSAARPPRRSLLRSRPAAGVPLPPLRGEAAARRHPGFVRGGCPAFGGGSAATERPRGPDSPHSLYIPFPSTPRPRAAVLATRVAMILNRAAASGAGAAGGASGGGDASSFLEPLTNLESVTHSPRC